ncbi:MAG: polyprenyl synthetase family protein [Bacteroidales bacterium]|nr:polyprenyl synthetase family protein [Bacteroidales bacterium]
MNLDAGVAKKILGSAYKNYRDALCKAIESEEPYLNRINRYVLSNEGKELRPILSLFMGMACGTLNNISYCCAAATEMLHTATLMHDDVADNATMRRFSPTVGAKFSPAAAVLTGDFWLSRALGLIIENCEKPTLSLFTKTILDISQGELLQMDKAYSANTTEEDYNRIIYCKTAVLFKAAMLSGAYSVGAEELFCKAAADYSIKLGMAFQIRDDILDYSSDMNTGKDFGSDLKERKITLPLLGAMANSPKDEEIIREKIREIEELPNGVKSADTNKTERLVAEIFEFVLSNKGIEYAQQRLEKYCIEAAEALAPLPSSDAKNYLVGFAEYVGKRNV